MALLPCSNSSISSEIFNQEKILISRHYFWPRVQNWAPFLKYLFTKATLAAIEGRLIDYIRHTLYNHEVSSYEVPV